MEDLEVLVGFLNTEDVDEGADELREPVTAARWLDDHGLLAPGTSIDDRGLQAARALRSALRRFARAHHDGRRDPAAAVAFAAVARALPMHAAADAAGQVELEPAGEGVHAALAHLVAAVVRACVRGTWPRVKVCPADDCQWAFVDRSKNQSRRWCAMGVCGNRQKTRAYRERRRERDPSDRGR